MATYKDLAEWALATLSTNSSVVALVFDGATGVFESGQLSPRDLDTAEEARRGAGENSKVLAVLAMDTGEGGAPGVQRVARVRVFVFDRRKGYTNIRSMREAVIEALLNKSASLVREAYVVKLGYAGRSGHMELDSFELDYEQIDFVGPLVHLMGGDLYS